MSRGTTAAICTLFSAQFINYIRIQALLIQLKQLKLMSEYNDYNVFQTRVNFQIN